MLDAAQRTALFRALRQHRVLDVPSSTRIAADDELPVLITLEHQGDKHRLLLWHGDARSEPRFHPFETELLALVHQLSNNAVLSRADE